MKKHRLGILFISIFLSLSTYSQDYLITFTAAGDTTAIEDILVFNLRSREFKVLPGTDTLHLIDPTGINAAGAGHPGCTVSPNPVTDRSSLTFETRESGEANITMTDAAGRILCSYSGFLQRGSQSFMISAAGNGIRFLNVAGSGISKVCKFINSSPEKSIARIQYLSTVPHRDQSLKNTIQVIAMEYLDRDQLLFEAISGKYATMVADVPASSKTIQFVFSACTDGDGKNYRTVVLGTQIWMAENLNVGTMIPGTQSQTNNGIIEKYCYDNVGCESYGGLYQWNEMMQYDTTAGSQGICPAGWHLPTDMEWTELTGNITCNPEPGGALKSTGTIQSGSGLWEEPNTGATDCLGFSAVPEGWRNSLGNFELLHGYATFWQSTQDGVSSAWGRHADYDNPGVDRRTYDKSFGMSVRCVKN
jgi:uncharacterized protein (TIGR02145 family)